MKTTCPQCGDGYQRLGQHWNFSPTHRPAYTENQKEILTGLMMGDGTLQRRNEGNPRIKVKMITEEYLKHLDDVFGVLSSGVRFATSGEENAKRKQKNQHWPETKKENYNDLYEWHSRTHPSLEMFDWYSSGKKVWPERIELTPTVLKHWFVGDGHYHRRDKHLSISMNNEVDNQEKVSRFFANAEIPKPDRYRVDVRENFTECSAFFTVEDSKTLYEYMGDPLPGFQHKWP
jgi:hypothetical protein